MAQFSPDVMRKLRRQALKQMALGPDGKLHPNAKLVMAWLRRQCNGAGVTLGPDAGVEGPRIYDKNGALDPIAMAWWAGRRSVFDLLAKELSLPLEDRHNLKDGL